MPTSVAWSRIFPRGDEAEPNEEDLRVTYWMTFNEINNQMNTANPLFLWTNSGVIAGPGENATEVMYRAGHHELLASAKAVAIGKAVNPNIRIGWGRGCPSFRAPRFLVPRPRRRLIKKWKR